MFSTVTFAVEPGLTNVYLDSAQWYQGHDDNDGASAENPVQSFSRAQELVASGGTIWSMSIAVVQDTQVWDLTSKPGVVIKRAPESTHTMVSVLDNGSLTIKNIIFDGTSNKSQASLLTVQGSGKLVMDTGSIIENNNTTNPGAGVYLKGQASLTMQGNAKIRNNHTTYYGGGVAASGASIVTIKDSASITGNSAKLGGGVYIVAFMNLSGGSISTNTATDSGGGIFIESNANSILFTGGTISENTAKGQIDPNSGLGNDIYSNKNQTWTLSGSWKTSQGIFLNNTAKMLITSKVENPLRFEGIRNTSGLEGTVVAEGSNGYALTSKDLSQFSCKEPSTGFDLDTINNQIIVKILEPYTVDFDVNGGNGDNFTQMVYPKNKVIKPNDPTKAGNIFSGWYNGSIAFDFENAIISENTRLTAKWHAHSFDEDWKSNATEHWRVCVVDGAKSDVAQHTPGAPATSTQGQVCKVCGYEISPKLPAKESVADADTGIKMEYEDGTAFDDDITLAVSPKSAEEMKGHQDNVNKVIKGLSIAGLYDIKLLKNGMEIQPNGKVKITLTLTDEMKNMTDLEVIYIDNNGNVTIIPSQIIDGTAVFITDHLSYYGVIGKVSQANKPENSAKPNNGSQNKPSSPQTGDTSSAMPYLSLILLSGGVVGFGLKKKYLSR